MIERIARCLAADAGYPHSARQFHAQARRLLAAMCEPTPRMSDGLPHGYRPGSHSAREIWNALITGALAEGPLGAARSQQVIDGGRAPSPHVADGTGA